MSARLRLAVPAIAAALGLLASGCGTRMSEDEVRAGVQTGPVEIAPESLEQLRSAGSAPVAAPAASDPGGATAPAAVGSTPGGPAAPAAQPGEVQVDAAVPTAARGSAPASARSAACTGREAPLPIGQIGSFSGVMGPITASGRTALAVWVKHVNASGGLACHPVTLYVMDDGMDPSRGAAAVGTLATQHKVQALVSLWAPLSIPAMRSAIERYRLPVVGGDSVMPDWYQHPLLFPQGAGLNGAVAGALRQAVDAGFTKIGMLYCVETPLCAGVQDVVSKYAEQMGAKLVYSSPVSLTQTDFTAQCQNAKNAGVQSFGMGVDGSTITRVVRSCAALGYRPQLISGAMLVSAAQANDPGMRQNTLSVSTPNAPWMLTENAGQKEFAAALDRYAPGTPRDAVSLASWAAAQLFVVAIENLGDATRTAPITSESILTGLGRVKNETLDGLAPPITFSPGQKSAHEHNCVYYALLTERGWEAPRGNKYVCF
ncbi:ABC transporter substrate-binding protein [Sporichthya brevicatena]